jgi:hypothetical protein
MDMTKYSSPTYIKVDNLRDGPLHLQIAAINEGKYDKPDAVFETGEMLSLNGTNVGILIRAYGRKSEGWIGKEVELAPGTVKFNGEPQEVVIVKPISPPIATPTPKADGFNDEVPF